MTRALVSTVVLGVLCGGVGACGDSDLPAGIARFEGVDPELSSEELAPLWTVIGEPRIVALGESIHTSGGFYAAKRRLIQTMIEEQGVRVIAFETPRNRARQLDAYLTGGECDRPATELFGISVFEVFVDDNLTALMRWICARNAAMPGDPVHLFGVDIQQSDEDAAEIDALLGAWAADEAPALRAGVSTCIGTFREVYTTEEHDACLRGLDALESWSAAHRDALAATAGVRATQLFELAERGFRAEQDHLYLLGVDLAASYEPRDRGMAEVFQRVLALDYPADARVVVWAHNVHIARNHDRIEETVYTSPRATTLGTVLGQVYGDDYAPVALTGYAPGTNWPQAGRVALHSELGTRRGSVEAKLHALGAPYLIVDPAAAYLDPDRAQELSDEISVPRETYAAIVYLDDTPPMNAVFW